MRRLAPRPLSAALEALTATLAPATPLARVQSVWRDTVGERIAAEAHPTSERAGVVTVACASAVWAQELDFMQGELVERLNQALAGDGSGQPVSALRLVVGS